jgi:hypothetical protein
MPTATEAFALSRRRWLTAVAAAGVGGAARSAPAPGSFALAWETGGGWRIGVTAIAGNALAERASLEVPTRAHGLLWHGRQLLAVARRPGDWLVRWSPATRAAQWAWIEPDRAFNGHVVASGDGRQLYTTETDLATGQGLVGVRDARSLEKLAEWPTGGMDPHELLPDADGTLLVANGGIPTLPETGRLKIGLQRMDASLVRLDTVAGEMRGQWRLEDARLSPRHIAWGGHQGRRLLGIALQAEHADPKAKREAPVLALFDGRQLSVARAPRSLAGYGGDIAFAAGRFAVSCPRVDGVALYGGDGAWADFQPLQSACALASRGDRLWAAGQALATSLPGGSPLRAPRQLRLDNHWLALS